MTIGTRTNLNRVAAPMKAYGPALSVPRSGRMAPCVDGAKIIGCAAFAILDSFRCLPGAPRVCQHEKDCSSLCKTLVPVMGVLRQACLY